MFSAVTLGMEKAGTTGELLDEDCHVHGVYLRGSAPSRMRMQTFSFSVFATAGLHASSSLDCRVCLRVSEGVRDRLTG
ncbi:hypothetical protein BT67DRAFT_444856 [Trichocladium antarcticum]|uniref:Uncharacterized protein n=1 Tax=Trichocladium antarcticum TaxID=1450529 RepID=A0AAN6UE17_9PEZI|nr:hypothetical protein BT67DRAFT_444856 [Trichocladium antarcticum]